MLTIVYRQDDGFSMVNGRRLSRDMFDFAALSSDERPSGIYQSAVIANGSTLTEIDTGTVYSYDEQHSCWCVQSGAAGPAWQIRVTSLTDTEFSGGALIDAVGIPAYISDVSGYAEYGIEAPGWYVFARITPRDGSAVTPGTTVTGAAGAVLTEGADHVDVAVRFEVAAQSKKVTIDWGTYSETFVFRAPDLAIRNLDYRSTFYVYDLAPYATHTYKRSTDAAFVGTKYYTEDEGVYTQAAVKALEDIPEGYYTEADGVYTPASGYFDGTAYYIEEDGEYVQAAVKAGETRPEAYYTEEIVYLVTEDETFVAGKTYYTEDGGAYTAAEVTEGEEIPSDTYYIQAAIYHKATGTFEAGTTYYTAGSSDTYTAATVTVGDVIPDVEYLVHDKVRFEGMPRNVTYRYNTFIDCPVEIVLPIIEDDGYGAWYEMQLRHKAQYSTTLVPQDEGIKVATDTTPSQTKGINALMLQYASVGGAKVWRLINTHSNFAGS